MARTILVVEDETTLRETLADALEAEGFQVVQAGEGRDRVRRQWRDPVRCNDDRVRCRQLPEGI